MKSLKDSLKLFLMLKKMTHQEINLLKFLQWRQHTMLPLLHLLELLLEERCELKAILPCKTNAIWRWHVTIMKQNNVLKMKEPFVILAHQQDLKKHNKFINQVSKKQKKLSNTHKLRILESLILLNRQESSLLHCSGLI